MKQPPQLKASPLIGHYARFKKDPISLLLDASEQLGDIFMLKVLNKPIYFVNHPDLIAQVTQTNYENYIKTPATPLRSVLGEGIFTVDGEEWLKRRRLYQPALNNTAVKSYTSTVVESANEMMTEIDQLIHIDKAVNISRMMSSITISILGKTLFSTQVQLQNSLWDDIGTIVEWIGNRRLRHPFVVPVNWPTKQNKAFKHAVDRLDKMIYNIIETKKQHNDNSEDLLSRFMDHDEENIPKLNDKELRDEVVTIFLAGHETSANVLNWAFYTLAENQEIQQKVYDEVYKLGDKTPEYEDLHQLNYTVQVLNEVMRLYPPVWHFGRVNLEEDQLGGYVIPKGSAVRISPLTIQRRNQFWSNPEVFDPDRFSAENEQVQYTFIPFGAGPRLCAGRNFAMMEMTMILAMVVRKYKFTNVSGLADMAPMVTLRTRHDVKLKFEER